MVTVVSSFLNGVHVQYISRQWECGQKRPTGPSKWSITVTVVYYVESHEYSIDIRTRFLKAQ